MGKQRIVKWQVEEGGERLDRYLVQELGEYSRSVVQKLIAEGLVTVNGAIPKASYRIEAGDTIQAVLPAPEGSTPLPEPIALDIIYQDDDLLVINKPAGMVVHPAPGHASGTLVNALLARFPALAGLGSDRPGIVHRLDRDTSGLIVVALHEGAREQLQRQFKGRRVRKVYLALLEGRLEPPRGVVEAPIGRDPRHRQRMAIVASGGRPARTSYRVREYLDRYTLVEVRPETGRTHQIRVHLAAIGHPIAGDRIYGRKKGTPGLPRQFLHAWRLTLTLPGSDERRTFTAPLPDDLQQVLEGLRPPQS